jgi:putative oxidoreductase
MNAWFKKNADLGILLFRMFLSIRIIYGVIDNVLSWSRMIEFSKFLEVNKFPYPMFSALLSVYAQLLAGLFILAGWKTRFASLILVINFMVAIFTVHRKDSFEAMTPALAMLFGSVLLLFTGPGRYGLERTNFTQHT